MKLFSATGLFLLLFLSAQAADVSQQEMLETPADCSVHLPWGKPEVPGNLQMVCKEGYTSFFDLDHKIPRLVTYREKGADTLGCLPRLNTFHTERLLPVDNRPSSGDYAKTGYDLGHNAPDQDMATTHVRLFDSFNLANVSPQVPGLNRQGWESLEELVRAWAVERGEVVIYVGAVIPDNGSTIGRNKVAVPTAFFKVVIDPSNNESIAFLLPQQDVPKGDISPYETTVFEIEHQTGIKFTLPLQTDRNAKPAIWHGDVSAWHKAHKAACHVND